MSSKKPSNKRQPEPSRKAVLEALKRQSELDLEDQIRRLMAKPMHERTHFLRKKVGLTGSAI